MFVRFKELTQVDAFLNICCFSGHCKEQVWVFEPGEVFEVKDVVYGKAQKTKTRPGKPGGRVRRHCTIYLKGKIRPILTSWRKFQKRHLTFWKSMARVKVRVAKTGA